MIDRLSRLRAQLRQLAARFGPAALPTRRTTRSLESLLRGRLARPPGGSPSLPDRVAEVVAFVEDGVDRGSFDVGALAWVAARAAELLEPRPEPTSSPKSPAPPLERDPLVSLTQNLLGAAKLHCS